MNASNKADLIGWLASLLPFGVILLDGERKIVFLSPSAKRILAANDGLGMSGGGLAAYRKGDDARISRLIAERAGGAGAIEGNADGFLALHRPSGQHPYGMLVAAVPRPGNFQQGQVPAVAMFLSDPQRPATVSDKALRHLFALTHAEAALARLLVAGLSLEDAAGNLGVTTKTARGYLYRIFRKTGARRQSDVLRIVLGSVAVLGGDDAKEAAGERLRSGGI